MGTIVLKFPDPLSAKLFVRELVGGLSDVAVLRDGNVVRVVDGSHLHAREILRTARLHGGEAA